MRKRGRLDTNHPEIVAALADIGAKVLSLANMGNGTPDILVGFRGRLFLMEIKSADRPAKLTPDEEKWHYEWAFCAMYRVPIVRTVDDALRAIGAIED